jgi:cob(I)alamin adenosyltransferase
MPNDRAPHEQGRPPTDRPRRAAVRARSLILVNTGDGKGKTTAALGTALRAVAQGWSVCVIQFIKSGRWKVGEEAAARRLGIEWWSIGDGFTWDSRDMDRTQATAREAWRVAAERIGSNEHRLVVLDELTYAINWGWVPIEDVLQVLASRPPDVSVIVTGRDASPELVELADTVTEMRSRKHAFDLGVRAIRGLDF